MEDLIMLSKAAKSMDTEHIVKAIKDKVANENDPSSLWDTLFNGFYILGVNLGKVDEPNKGDTHV